MGIKRLFVQQRAPRCSPQQLEAPRWEITVAKAQPSWTTLDEIDNWDRFPIVFITPDGDAWDPHTSHYADNEEAMLDANGLIVEHGI